MRSLIIMAVLAVSVAHATYRDYSEVRNLQVDATEITHLTIDAGAGSIDVQGVRGSDKIVVKATITVAESDPDDARKLIESKMQLSLTGKGNSATLNSWFDRGFLGNGPDASIALEVQVPEGMEMFIDDGSGSIDVVGTAAKIRIDDGSGSISLRTVGSVDIDDGSGSIDIVDASGDVYVNDGSGSITVKQVAGNVKIDDGSGSIKVNDIGKDLIIVDSGSGSVTYANVAGNVEGDL
jgi:hypothetical protein